MTNSGDRPPADSRRLMAGPAGNLPQPLKDEDWERISEMANFRGSSPPNRRFHTSVGNAQNERVDHRGQLGTKRPLSDELTRDGDILNRDAGSWQGRHHQGLFSCGGRDYSPTKVEWKRVDTAVYNSISSAWWPGFVADPIPDSPQTMSSSCFRTDYDPVKIGIVQRIESLLKPNHSIEAEVTSLNVTRAGGKYGHFVNSCRSRDQRLFGFLVVSLPCPHKKGQFVVHQGRISERYDWSSSMINNWVAFRASRGDEQIGTGEIHVPESGAVVSLIFNLVYRSDCSSLPAEIPDLQMFFQIRSTLSDPRFMPRGGTIAVYCGHQYEHKPPSGIDLSPEALTGADAAVYGGFSRLGCVVKLRSVFTGRIGGIPFINRPGQPLVQISYDIVRYLFAVYDMLSLLLPDHSDSLLAQSDGQQQPEGTGTCLAMFVQIPCVHMRGLVRGEARKA